MPFFVWADPVDMLPGDLQFADHTWVTSYRPVPACPPDEANGEYWYCRGSCHTTPPANTGARLLAEGEGDIEFARSIGTPHDPVDDVGLRYGVFGLCHQMANRLTFFSQDANGERLTTEEAKLYFLSKAVYGKYGGKGWTGRAIREQWRQKTDSWRQFREAKESFNDDAG